MTDLGHLSARELVCLTSSGTVSCRDVIEAHVARIEAVNPALNALVEPVDPQRCLDAADEADRRASRGESLGSALGLPVVIKDVMKVAGLACSGGSPVLRSVADEDATAVSSFAPKGPSCSG